MVVPRLSLEYLDSAATTQRPRAVIDAIANFYLHDNANPAKSLHTLASRSATLYEKSVFSFVIANGQPLDIVKALAGTGIAVRGGDLASLPLLKRMRVTASVRASCYAYTTTEEIDPLVEALTSYGRGVS